MADDDKKKKDEGQSDYIDKVILNPNLEKELKEINSPFKIQDTPAPGKDDKDKKDKK